MRFAEDVGQKYRDAMKEAARTILEKGSNEQREVARLVTESDLLIRFVPLEQINVSGNAGIIDSAGTIRRIESEAMSVEDAMAEICLTFSDWTFDVAGQRGCQGTLVHEGLHACDFARVISAYSRGETETDFDITLYELERRAAIVSADYLLRIGKPDYIDDGLQLGLVRLDQSGKPELDMDGIDRRMTDCYGLTESNPGAKVSQMLGIASKTEGFSLRRFLGI